MLSILHLELNGSTKELLGTGTAPQRRSYSTKPDRVQEAFGQCCQTHGVNLGDGPVQDQELNSVVPVGLFQLSIYCNSKI